MPEAPNRIGSLSDDRKRLLERLLQQKGALLAGNGQNAGASRATAASLIPAAPSPGKQSFEQSDVKASYKRFYDAVNSQLDSSVFGPFSFFLNYGYLPNENPQYSSTPLPEQFVNKNSVKLVLELIGNCDLKDRRILDVGCGRGGTVFVIKQFFEPQSVQGVDLSSNAIASCRANHRYANVRFDEGDAEKLPFDGELFDVVTNVESSHSYPNILRFYREVFRLLVPGGIFLYTDVFPKEALPQHLFSLKELGFATELERDITANVLLSCDEIARTRVGAYDAGNDPELMNNFLAAPGSQVYEDMRTGRWSYRIYRFRKPGKHASSVADPISG